MMKSNLSSEFDPMLEAMPVNIFPGQKDLAIQDSPSPSDQSLNQV